VPVVATGLAAAEMCRRRASCGGYRATDETRHKVLTMRIPHSAADRTPLELQLTPMIDCVFLLLVYFLWSSSFTMPELVLPGQLAPPQASAGTGAPPPPQADFPELVVRVVTVQGRIGWTLNETPVRSLAELRATLATLASIRRQAPVILDPQPDVPLGDVIDALDVIRLAGFAQVNLAATL